MKSLLAFYLITAFLTVLAEDNIADKAECALIEGTDKLAEALNDPKPGETTSPNPCKDGTPPVSKRLDEQLNKDAKTIKTFFGFDNE
jgi:hypothetical protein